MSDNIIILGKVSYSVVRQHLIDSICVINPSVFEGWSTTVEEAKAFGKIVVLSNIPVHFEQNPNFSFYFDPSDAEELSSILLRLWLNNHKIKNSYSNYTHYKESLISSFGSDIHAMYTTYD